MPARGGRASASSSKVRRVSEDDVLSRWDMLSPKQRQAATRFEDGVLIQRIRDAIQDLFQQQALMQRMGIELGGPSDPSIFTTSALFTEVFDLPWKIHKSEEFPDSVLMDPDDQPSLMTLRHYFSEEARGRQLVERFRLNLGDFLAPTGRTPMPKARWKDLFANKASSVASLEEQLAKLFEQALWAMALDPSFEILEAKDLVEEVVLEDWVDELEADDAKPKKKKKKKKKAAATMVEEETVADNACHDEMEDEQEDSQICKAVVAIVEEEIVAGNACHDEMEHEQEDMEHATEISAECFDEMPSCSSSSLNRQQGSSQSQRKHQASVLQEHYWGSRQREPMMSELFNLVGRRRTQQARASQQSHRNFNGTAPPPELEAVVETESKLIMSDCVGILPVSEVEPLPSPSQHLPPSRDWKPSQLVRYIWNQTSQMEQDTVGKRGVTADAETPSLPSSAACSTPWSAVRGFWATPNGDASPKGACVLERNTFLELHQPEETVSLRPRSLSPTYMKAADVASLSTNYWHR